MPRHIDRLTPEQTDRMASWADEWIAKGLATGPADRETFERAARACYRHAGLPEPRVIVWCQSPIVVALAGPSVTRLLDRRGAVRDAVRGAVGGAWYKYLGGQFWISWQAYTSFFRDVCGLELLGDLWRRERDYADAQSSACWWWPHRDFIMVSERPLEIHREQVAPRGWGSHRLHCTTGPAIVWPDGWGVYSVHGVRVPAWLVETPAEQLDPLQFPKLDNAEVRREFVRKIGVERLCEKLGTKVLDRRGDYELHLINLGGETGEWPYLKMKNPSIGVYHMEAVDKTCRTVEAALNFRNGGPLEHIAPLT